MQGKLPLSRELLSCRFPFNLQLLHRVWVRGKVDLADPSHKTAATLGNRQWRTAAQFRRDFCASRLLLPAVSGTSQSGKGLNSQLMDTANIQRAYFCHKTYSSESSSVPLPSSHPDPLQPGAKPGGHLPCTSAYLIITDGHRGVQKVPYLSEVLKPLCFQLYPLGITL